MDAVIKKIPYGMTDFERIILENYYYVDKTQYIAKVEKVTSFFFFVRPRRFGKSLFLNMLGLYYDINQKDKFEKIFGNLYIGKHPTPDRNKYLVLTLNFSSVAANMDRLEETFNTYCKIVMDGFAERNAHLLGKEAAEKLHELKTGDALLGSLCQSAQNKGLKIYLILDEYDNFANNILVSDMVLYFMNHYMLNEDIPDNMLDANIRTDYNKLRHLIHVDKTFGENASVVQEIVEKGSTTGIIANSFPAEDIIKPENFKSLLYYYGMLTISGMEMGEPILSVPNWAVREQLYGYMADIYKDSADLYLETDKLVDRMKRMAYKGEWENCFTYIADRLNAQSSVRDFIEGEAYVKTFILAYLGLTHYYIARPEYESNKGYADIFLQPRLLQLPDMVYSYCIEVKYAKRDASDTEIEKLLSNAKIQLKQYAASEWIHQDKGTTELKSIALVFQGWKLVRVEEV